MKILLVNAPPIKNLGITGQTYPPLGILYLASYAESKINDIQIKAIDGYQEHKETLVNRIIKYNPDVLGVSFTTQGATGAYKLINEVKEINDKIFTVSGGAHPTIFPEEVFNRSRTDIAVIGEGEVTFTEILNKISGDKKGLEDILGTAVRQNGMIKRNPIRPVIRDLDEIPFPARHLLDINKYPGYIYKKFKVDTDIVSSRGCPYNCVYCSNPVWKLQKPWYRLRSPQNVVDEIEFIINEYGIKEIYDQTDEFNGSKKWAKDVCDEIIKRDLGIAWKAQMRVDHVDEELAKKLKDSGFWMGHFGLESANEKTLKGIRKRQTIDQMENALNIFQKYGLKAFGLFMAFNVWEENGKLCYESKEDSLRTLEYIKSLVKKNKLFLFAWSMTTPYPGNELYDIALKHRLVDEKYIGKWEYYDSGANFIMNLPGLSERDWLDVFNSGKKLQAKLLFSTGTFNFKALPLYMKKLYYLVHRNFQKFFYKETVTKN